MLSTTTSHDQQPTIVLELGSVYIKYGVAGEARPRGIVPWLTTTSPSSLKAALGLDTTDPVQNSQGVSSPPSSSSASIPLPHSVMGSSGSSVIPKRTISQVSPWNASFDQHAFESLLATRLEHLFLHLILIDASRAHILLCEHLLTPRHWRSVVIRVLFERFRVLSLACLPTPWLGLVCTGRAEGFVVDIGYDQATLVPIYDGKILHGNVKVLSMGGKQLVRRLQEKSTQGAEVTGLNNEVCEELGQLLAQTLETTSSEEERLKLLSSLLLEDEEGGNLAESIGVIIAHLPIDCRRTVASNILLCGGYCMIDGFRDLLQQALSNLNSQASDRAPRASSRENRHHLAVPMTLADTPFQPNVIAWVGGSLARTCFFSSSSSALNSVPMSSSSYPMRRTASAEPPLKAVSRNEYLSGTATFPPSII